MVVDGVLGAVMEIVVRDFDTSAVARWTPLLDFLADLKTAAREGVGNVPATKVHSVSGDGTGNDDGVDVDVDDVDDVEDVEDVDGVDVDDEDGGAGADDGNGDDPIAPYVMYHLLAWQVGHAWRR